MRFTRRFGGTLAVAALAWLAGCSPDQTLTPTGHAPTGSSANVSSGGDTILGPISIVRSQGAPTTTRSPFTAPAGTSVSVTVSAPSRTGLSATVAVNGTVVMVLSDTSTLPQTAMVVATGADTVSVRMAGKPGSAIVLTARTAYTAPWWNALLDFNGGHLPSGWYTTPVGSFPGLVNDRLESTPVDNGPYVMAIGPAPAGILGVVVQYDASLDQSTWGHGSIFEFWTGGTRNSVGVVNATFNFGAGQLMMFGAHRTPAQPTTADTVPFTAGAHWFRAVVRQDSTFLTTQLASNGSLDAHARLQSPGWDIATIDSVGVRAVASDVAAWMDNVHVRAITSLATVATLDLAPSSDSIVAGGILHIGAEARNIMGTVMAGPSPSWTSSDPSVATVSASGTLTAVRSGTVVVTATVDGAVGRAVIRVVPAQLTIVAAQAKYEHLDTGTTTSGDTWSGVPMAAADGSFTTLYSSRVRIADDPDQWWQADVGTVATVSRISVRWQQLEPQWWKDVVVAVSADGLTWTDVSAVTRVNIDGTDTDFNVTATARYVRIRLVGSGSPNHGYDLTEVRVFGSNP